MGLSGFPITEIDSLRTANTIFEDGNKGFFYSETPSYDIYYYEKSTKKHTKLIERTFLLGSYSNNDFSVTSNGIYFMDRVAVKQNAIYYYSFADKSISYVVPSKDNYPSFVISDDEKFIYLIESYDNNSYLKLLE